MSKSITGNGLTIKQNAFVEAYAGNIEEAADIAGLSYQYCRRMMMDATKGNIEFSALAVQTAIKNRRLKRDNSVIMSREARQRLWTQLAEDDYEDNASRLRASELLGKSEGDFIDLKADVTPQSLADIAAITQSRRRKAIESKELAEIAEKNEDETNE